MCSLGIRLHFLLLAACFFGCSSTEAGGKNPGGDANDSGTDDAGGGDTGADGDGSLAGCLLTVTRASGDAAPVVVETMRYDAAAFLVEVVIVLPDGTPYHTYNYTYDADGRVLTTDVYVESISSGYVATYTYDEAGNRILYEYAEYGAVSQTGSCAYEFDESNREIGATCDGTLTCDGDGGKSCVTEWTDSGLEATKTSFYPDGATYRKHYYTYDENGEQLTSEEDRGDSEQHESPDGIIDSYTLSIYDERDLRTHREDGRGDVATGSFQTGSDYKYDAENRETEDRYYEDARDNLRHITTTYYDHLGRLSHEDSDEDLDGAPDSVTTYTYECSA